LSVCVIYPRAEARGYEYLVPSGTSWKKSKIWVFYKPHRGDILVTLPFRAEMSDKGCRVVCGEEDRGGEECGGEVDVVPTISGRCPELLISCPYGTSRKKPEKRKKSKIWIFYKPHLGDILVTLPFRAERSDKGCHAICGEEDRGGEKCGGEIDIVPMGLCLYVSCIPGLKPEVTNILSLRDITKNPKYEFFTSHRVAIS